MKDAHSDREDLVEAAVSQIHVLEGRNEELGLAGFDVRRFRRVAASITFGAQAAEATVKHLRTAGGDREIDLIVERADGRVVGIDVKLARDVTDDHVHHLRWLSRQIGDELLDSIVITTGQDAYRRRDGIAVVPAALLGP